MTADEQKPASSKPSSDARESSSSSRALDRTAVPTRGSFYLHDSRSSKPPRRGKSRNHEHGSSRPSDSAGGDRWEHDKFDPSQPTRQVSRKTPSNKQNNTREVEKITQELKELKVDEPKQPPARKSLNRQYLREKVESLLRENTTVDSQPQKLSQSLSMSSSRTVSPNPDAVEFVPKRFQQKSDGHRKLLGTPGAPDTNSPPPPYSTDGPYTADAHPIVSYEPHVVYPMPVDGMFVPYVPYASMAINPYSSVYYPPYDMSAQYVEPPVLIQLPTSSKPVTMEDPAPPQ